MRVIVIGLMLGVALTPVSAEASCSSPPWIADDARPDVNFPADGFPVDAEVWLHVGCGTITGGCSLVADDHVVELAIAAVGEAACALDVGEVHDPADYLLRLTPAEALLPGHTYQLECEQLLADADGFSQLEQHRVLEVVTRADAGPSSPPGEVVVASARQVRSDVSLCRCVAGDTVGLALGELDEAYLREGGRIEATYPNGQVFPISAVTELEDGEVRLPYTAGPIALTPVAANGVRGEAVTVEAEEIDEQAVYIPCRSSLAGPSRALWWLLPVLWIGARRRRASARGAE